MRRTVGIGVDRLPKLTLPLKLTMASIVDQQIVTGGQGLVEVEERGHDLLTTDVLQQPDLETVTAFEQLGHRSRIVDRGLERRQLEVVVVADHQRVVGAEEEVGGSRRGGRRLGRRRRLRGPSVDPAQAATGSYRRPPRGRPRRPGRPPARSASWQAYPCSPRARAPSEAKPIVAPLAERPGPRSRAGTRSQAGIRSRAGLLSGGTVEIVAVGAPGVPSNSTGVVAMPDGRGNVTCSDMATVGGAERSTVATLVACTLQVTRAREKSSALA